MQIKKKIKLKSTFKILATNHEFPQKICADCADKLKDTYDFAEKALRSDNILKNYISTKVCDISCELQGESKEFKDNENMLHEEFSIKNEDIELSCNLITDSNDNDTMLSLSEEYEDDIDLSECNKYTDNEEVNELIEQNDKCGNENDKCSEVKKSNRRPQKYLMCHICCKLLLLCSIFA